MKHGCVKLHFKFVLFLNAGCKEVEPKLSDWLYDVTHVLQLHTVWGYQTDANIFKALGEYPSYLMLNFLEEVLH